MKTILSLIILITFPVLTFGQKASDNSEKKNEIITFNLLATQLETEDQNTSFVYTKSEVTNLSYKKSIDLISIKAYRKSLQIKVKEVRTC